MLNQEEWVSIKFASHWRNQPQTARFSSSMKAVSEPQNVKCWSFLSGADVQAGPEAVVQYRALHTVGHVSKDALTDDFDQYLTQ